MIYETNCIVVTDNNPETQFWKKCGDNYWNETENIVCWPTKEMTPQNVIDLESMYGIKNLTKAEFLIIRF